MKLYLDNYKGFSKTFIPFEDINFLVGENSTGKTAVLDIISMIMDNMFWFSPNFKFDEMGCFSDLVSQKTTDVTHFFIGYESDKDTELQQTRRFLFVFSNKDNKPVLTELKFNCVDETIIYKNNSNIRKLRLKVRRNIEDSFEEWVYNDDGEDVEWDNEDKITINGVPMLFLMSYIENKESKEGRLFKSNLPIWRREKDIAPVRVKAKRIYEPFTYTYASDGSHIPTLLYEIFTNEKRHQGLREELVKFGKNSGMFDDIQINIYGDQKQNPFSIEVCMGEVTQKLTNVGYGVSQVLPIIIETLNSRRTLFAIQQPEVHLHAKAQAAYGEVLYLSAKKYRNLFIMETHSDFMIDRIRYNIHLAFENSESSPKAQVLFFQRDDTGNHVRPIPIDEQGHYAGEIPAEYTSFFIDEELKMLEF